VSGRSAWTTPCVALTLALSFAAVACREAPPTPVGSVAQAPDSFLVALETSAGRVTILMRREWSPLAVDRIHELALANHWAGARIYRVNPRYAQFGYTGRPSVDSAWIDAGLPDEPVRASNLRGTVSFARGGPGTRSVVLFVNRGDNSNLDALQWQGVLGFPPVGTVIAGMEVVDAFHDDYGEEPLEWEDSIARAGNAFLDRRFPGLDSIIRVEVVEDWP
jgi:cyclophilin family peptidyl-prolyl cis-trans isomerase